MLHTEYYQYLLVQRSFYTDLLKLENYLYVSIKNLPELGLYILQKENEGNIIFELCCGV